MKAVHSLKDLNNSSTLTLLELDGEYLISIENNRGSSHLFQLCGISGKDFQDLSPHRILLEKSENYLCIESRQEWFEVIIRNKIAPFVGIESEIGTHNWYGLGNFMRQEWPLERLSLDYGPFYTFDVGSTGLCNQADPTLVTSSGLLVKANDSSPCLHLGFNSGAETYRPDRDWDSGILIEGYEFLPRLASKGYSNRKLKIHSRKSFDWPYIGHPWKDSETKHVNSSFGPELKFILAHKSDVRIACDLNLKLLFNTLGPRNNPPPIEILQSPIWTTWARYGPEINEEKVLKFAEEIASRDLPRSVMEIDDKWSPKYGELEFDRTKFPDPKNMVEKLHRMGFKVTLWVTPFAQMDTDCVRDESTEKYFMQNESGEVGSFRWWQPFRSAGLDVFSDEACKWFTERLEKLRLKYGIDGFKFDAGEGNFIPKNSLISKKCRAPSEYTRRWVNNVAANFPISEVRCSVQGTQKKSSLLRMLDRYSTWTTENGLASVIPATITSSILGFPYTLPDMIGGNDYGDDKATEELIIRWAQLTSALCTMQFSLAPWDYGKRCDLLCSNTLKWREEIFWKFISNAVQQTSTYTPIIRPMWWVDQGQSMLEISDQYLVGDDLLICPILENGGRRRLVAFPSGSWKRVQLPGVSVQHKDILFNSGVITYVEADIDDMPVFIRQK